TGTPLVRCTAGVPHKLWARRRAWPPPARAGSAALRRFRALRAPVRQRGRSRPVRDNQWRDRFLELRGGLASSAWGADRRPIRRLDRPELRTRRQRLAQRARDVLQDDPCPVSVPRREFSLILAVGVTPPPQWKTLQVFRWCRPTGMAQPML